MSLFRRITLPDRLRLTYALAQGSLLALLMIILDRWMPSPLRPDLALVCLLLPLTTLGLVMVRAKFRSRGGQIAIAISLAAGCIALSITSFFDPALSPAGGRYQTGHYARLVFLAGFMLAAWVLGWRMAISHVTPKRAIAGMQWGLVSMVGLLFVTAQGGISLALPWLPTLGFLFFSLAALWLAQKQGAASAPGPDGSGAGAFFIGLGGVCLITLVMWVIAQAGLADHLAGPAAEASRMLTWFWEKVEQILLWLFGPFGAGTLHSRIPASPAGQMAQAPIPPGQPPPGSGAFFGMVLVVLICAAALAGLGYLLYKLGKWITAEGSDEPEQGRGRRGRLAFSLSAIFKGLLYGLGAWLKSCCLALASLGPGRRSLTVEHYYRRLVTWAQRRGLPRGPSQTPYEFRDRLSAAAPQLAASLDAITHAFVENRYGPPGPMQPAPSEVIRSWEQVRADKTLRRQGPGLWARAQNLARSLARG